MFGMLTTYTLVCPYSPCWYHLSRVGASRPLLNASRHSISKSRVLKRRNRVSVGYQGDDHELVVPDYIVPVSEEARAVVPDQTVIFSESLGQTIYVEKNAKEEHTPLPENLSLVETPKPKLDGRSQNQKILAEVMAIALPALGTVLADPLMSLVDTACVGQISAIQLAALGPNTAIFNFIFLAFSFMGSALANVLASNSLKTPGLDPVEFEKRKEHNETMLSHTVLVALGTGTLMATMLLLCGRNLLLWMGTHPTVMPAALQYLLIRALASPAVLFIAVSQGACLGQQDMWTPMRVVAAAGMLNLVGDILLILVFGMGTFGAASATVAAQIAGAFYFYQYLRRKITSKAKLELKWKGLPTKASLKPLLEMGRVLMVRNMVLMLSYTVMTAIATTMGTLTLAAHQVTLQLFWFLSFMPEPLSLTAQSLIARDKDDQMKIRNLSYVLMRFGCSSGLALAAAFCVTLTFVARFFSSDLNVILEFQKVIPHGMLSLILCSISNMFDGISIGTKQIEHLPRLVYISTGATLGYLWLVQKHSLGLRGIWCSVIIFFFSRCFLHVVHLLRNWQMSPFGAALTPHTLDARATA